MDKRTIYILRHAEAVSSANGDKERPLTAAGRQAAATLGEKLKGKAIQPEVVLCSDARRTSETAELMALSVPVSYQKKLYNAPASEIYEQIKTVPADSRSVLVIAHNPGVSDLVRFLTGTPMCFAPGVFAVLETESDSWEALMLAGSDLLDVL